MASIKDVAKRASVSIATVSNVFNNPDVVSPETIARVNQAVEELDYHPSRIAQGLVGAKTRMIGVVVPDINNLVYSATVKAIEATLREHDYSMLLLCTEYNFSYSQKAVRYLLENKVDGVIFTSSAAMSSDCITQMIKHQVPVVGADILSEMIDAVQTDVVEGVVQAMKHLIDLGHTRIGFISSDLHNGPLTRRASKRFEGYIKAIQQNGLPLDPRIIHSEGNASFELGRSVMQNWIDEGAELPTAILAARDDIASGILVAASSSGIKIPEELSVVGYANYYYSGFLTPPLTTINAPAFETGKCCAELMLKRLKNPSGKREKIMLQAELVVRGSTAPPRTSL